MFCKYFLPLCGLTFYFFFGSVHSLSRVWLFVIPSTAAHQASLPFTNSWSLLKLMAIESVMPSNYLNLFSSCPQSFPASGSFPMSSSHQVPKYWSFSFSISPSNEYSGWISFNWLAWSCCPRDSQESSPTPQIKSINSSALSFLYGPTLTSIHDY